MGGKFGWFGDMFLFIMLLHLASSVCVCVLVGSHPTRRPCNQHDGTIISMHPSAKIAGGRTMFASENVRECIRG